MTNLLTSTALEQFEKWLSHHELHWYFEDLPDFVQLAYYVKWLDEQDGICLSSKQNYFREDFTAIVADNSGYYTFEGHATRELALTEAVIKAGQIINERLLTK